MQLSRESILRMFEGSGSGGSGGGAGSSQMAAMLQGYATQSWVDENYVGIEFFNRLFRVHGADDAVIVPNDLETTIQNIEARFGLWTESFLSALGLNSGGGGGGSVSYLNDLLDVSITNPTVGEGLIYDGTRWVNGPIGGGGTGSVESVGLSMPTGFSVTGSPVTTSGTLAVVFASGYSLPPTSKQAQWDAAYSWGDHSQEGYATQSWVNAKGYTTNTGTVTSVRMTVPAGLTVTGSPITTSGTLAISLGTGYSIPTTAKQSQWDTAYGWGNHADAGYATEEWVNGKGYATQSWVDENYVSIEFFNRLFRMHGDNDTVIVPNDLDTTIQNIEARFGLWTESFLSALGLNSGGGGGGSVSYLNDLLDVSITNPTVGEGLIYDGTRWVNGPIGGGGTGSVESVGLSMPTGFSVTGSPVTTSGTLAVVFASGYSLPPTSKQAQWDAAYSWGDHSQEGYATQSWVNAKGYTTNTGTVTSVRMTVPAGLTVTGSPITTSGTLAVGFASGYSLPPTSKQAQWDTAYSWGDHSQEGYATQSWVNAKGYTTNTGTVTSVRMTVPAGLTVTGSPITTSGTLAISLGTGYSIPTTAKQSQWDTAYWWGNHADAGYAAQTALAAAVTRITTLEGYFTNGVANQAARLSGSATYQAWGQEYWRNGQPLSISGRLSSVTDIMMNGSINVSGDGGLNYLVGQNYISAILRNSTYKQLVVGYGTSQSGYNLFLEGKDVEVRLWDSNSSTFKTPLAMSLDGNRDPYVQVDKTLRIGDGNGHYFPVTYDSANNALCFTGNIYATGGVSALGFSSTANGGAMINGALEVNGTANLKSDVTVKGNETVEGNSLISGDLTVDSSIEVTSDNSGSTFITGPYISADSITVDEVDTTNITVNSTTTLKGNSTFTVKNNSSTPVNITIKYNGVNYTFNMQKAIDAGIFVRS